MFNKQNKVAQVSTQMEATQGILVTNYNYKHLVEVLDLNDSQLLKLKLLKNLLLQDLIINLFLHKINHSLQIHLQVSYLIYSQCRVDSGKHQNWVIFMDTNKKQFSI
jgi:hypothetical protein